MPKGIGGTGASRRASTEPLDTDLIETTLGRSRAAATAKYCGLYAATPNPNGAITGGNPHHRACRGCQPLPARDGLARAHMCTVYELYESAAANGRLPRTSRRPGCTCRLAAQHPGQIPRRRPDHSTTAPAGPTPSTTNSGTAPPSSGRTRPRATAPCTSRAAPGGAVQRPLSPSPVATSADDWETRCVPRRLAPTPLGMLVPLLAVACDPGGCEPAGG